MFRLIRCSQINARYCWLTDSNSGLHQKRKHSEQHERLLRDQLDYRNFDRPPPAGTVSTQGQEELRFSTPSLPSSPDSPPSVADDLDDDRGENKNDLTAHYLICRKGANIGHGAATEEEEGSVITQATNGSITNSRNLMEHELYTCDVEGCKAPPFQTQHLLDSHANVHSHARPFYCPVRDCPRSVGGKGFKRKNEMIRHSLIHESPGYVCPFCPDREHMYPRPTNLQRWV